MKSFKFFLLALLCAIPFCTANAEGTVIPTQPLPNTPNKPVIIIKRRNIPCTISVDDQGLNYSVYFYQHYEDVNICVENEDGDYLADLYFDSVEAGQRITFSVAETGATVISIWSDETLVSQMYF